jgi:hypothetical protein
MEGKFMNKNLKKFLLLLTCVLSIPLDAKGRRQQKITNVRKVAQKEVAQKRKEIRAQQSKELITQKISIPTVSKKIDSSKNDWCKRLEDQALLKIKRAYGLSDEQWEPIEEKLNLAKQVQQEALSKKRIDYKHDQQIPKDRLDIIYTLLKSQGIEPTSIDIIVGKYMHSGGIEAAAHVSDKGIVVSYHSNTGEFAKMQVGTPLLTIGIKTLSCSLKSFRYYMAHEIGHLLEAHILKRFVLAILPIRYGNTKEQRAALENFNFVIELIADQRAASGSKEIADLMLSQLGNLSRFDDKRPTGDYPCYRERYYAFKDMYINCFGPVKRSVVENCIRFVENKTYEFLSKI